MKNKIKKWHIALMSFMALFIAVFTSLFSLKADTVDEETGEILTDNWELSTVFYDSTVDEGKTPLTEINWDASDGGYVTGTPKIITVQINYKNTNTVTTYKPKSIQISIPNLIYSNGTGTAHDAQWTTSVIVGANTSTLSGETWDFITGDSPDSSQETFIFTNAKEFKENTNFEGSIQIQYTITPRAENTSSFPAIEQYEDTCVHNYSKTLKATLTLLNNAEVFTSPNYPENYPNNMTQEEYFWEYSADNAEKIYAYFLPSSKTAGRYDRLYFYNNKEELYYLSQNALSGKTLEIEGSYLKLAMSTDSAGTSTGFCAVVYTSTTQIDSNELSFNYTRTYTHPWTKKEFTVTKYAEKLTYMDGLPAGDYYWVKYTFKLNNSSYLKTSYPNIGASYYIEDTLPEECVVLDHAFNQLTLENNLYTDSSFSIYYKTPISETIYVGYPKSIYNEDKRDLNIDNTVNLYIQYKDEESYNWMDDATVNINLANFEFTYTGELYMIGKGVSPQGKLYTEYLLDDSFIHECENANCGYYKHVTSAAKWNYSIKSIYTGTPLTVRFGDDLMYITDANGDYRKLADNEYYIKDFYLPYLKNMNETIISYSKYNTNLYVRYAGDSDYTLYTNLADYEYYDCITFPDDKKVVAFYIQLDDMIEGLQVTLQKSAGGVISYLGTHIKPEGNIADTGTIHNFNYLQVFTKDSTGNLVLQNIPNIDSYSSYITQEEIAQYDLNTYGTYIQRSTANVSYKPKEYISMGVSIRANKFISAPAQDTENEIFSTTNRIGFALHGAQQFEDVGTDIDYLKKVFLVEGNTNLLTGFKIYDLLPASMELISTPEEMIDSITYMDYGYHTYFYNKNGEQVFNSKTDFANFIREHSSVIITENWNKTGRTKIEWIVDFSDTPLLHTSSVYNSSTIVTGCFMYMNTNISYDSYLEYGATHTNYDYVEGFYENGERLSMQSGTTDSGVYDSDTIDINENSNTTEALAYGTYTRTIETVISTHQDVTTLVQTDLSNFDIDTINTSCASEYKYKLRVRTGESDITNLIIYCNLEEAQPERTRWKGEFLGVDTSYAESKGYAIKVWYSEDENANTLSTDTSWQEYTNNTDKAKVKSLAFQYLAPATTADSDNDTTTATLPANSLTYVLINMKAPSDEELTTFARNACWTEWNAIDEYDQIVDGIIGINSNIVKVALPKSIEADNIPTISLKFTKEIQGETFDFENLKLNKTDEHIFMIRLTSLTANDDGTYNQVAGLLSSTQGLAITQIPIGTYLLEELGDNYFDFVEFTNNNDPEIIIEGVTFEKTDQGYIITVSEDLAKTVEFNIKVTNKTENKRCYEDKECKENLFLKNKLESSESGENPETPI